MYSATCAVAGELEELEGATQECTPGFVRLLLRQPVAPTKLVALTISTAGTAIRLDGHVVASNRVGDMWSAGVRLDATEETVAAAWTDLVKHLRATR